MPKVTEEHMEARKQQVLDAAACCFSREGFHRTTMQDICREASLSPGAVYRYFAGKEQIIEAMVDERRRQAMDFVHAAGGLDDTARAFEALSRVLFNEMEDMAGWAVGVELWAEAVRSPNIRDMLRDDLRDIRVPFQRIVRAGQERGDINPEISPEAMAEITVSFFHGLVTQKLLDPDMDVRRYVNTMREILTGRFWQGPQPEGGE